ncbi:MucR family transcriptional regulator [uncultured Sphingomonas sp.]|uniref:MucR family transcriptional regulator n=1 Tax=uncultured Sphingomonas sp. TaxID=158754 RepID=UPI0025CE3235|nr:MucR family transcriptional regulator [uncultured Sphingomonas sp.]
MIGNGKRNELATELTIAWLSNPSTRAGVDEVKAFLSSMNKAVADLSAPSAPAVEETEKAYEPAVSVRKSLANPDFIVSLIDGKPYRTLKRHLSGNGLTPAEYRQRYGLKADYPMTAPSYSDARKAMAKKIGLGRKPGQSPKKADADGDSLSRKSGAKAGSPKSVAAARAAAKAHLGGGAE